MTDADDTELDAEADTEADLAATDALGVDDGDLAYREKVFCHAYMTSNFNAAQAARAAGYSEKAARWQGYKMLQRPIVKAKIDELMRTKLATLDITDDRIIEGYASLAFAPAGSDLKDTDRLRALDGLSKIRSMFVERREVNATIRTIGQMLDDIDGTDNALPAD